MVLEDSQIFMSLETQQGMLDIFTSRVEFTNRAGPVMSIRLVDVT